ncbi:MAG: polyprenol phosphomannose-dependent alpha 1,6 mannosyltransferase MptB [Micropruina sp.]|uniref:polyprenol phosphomannose-dependent alpha 1,6 mannosyltransferase MptB n=1 Tax=Micropruina sp. TaxID=2737536 RepID=UPI0039E71154
MSGRGRTTTVPRPRWLTREALSGYRTDLATAWRVPAVKRGLLATFLLFVGSLTPAYLPQNSPWWAPIRALGWDTWPAKVIGTALVVAAVVLLVDAWFRLRPGLYLDFKHWAVGLIWSLPLLLAPPIFSHDAYSYAAQGWLLHNGLNPYDTPVSVLPGAFADQVAWVWRYTPAPYGPLSLQISHLMVIVGGLDPYVSTLLMRIPALIGVVLIVYFLPRLAGRLRVDVQLAAWFSTINPLLIIDLVGGMHNDALMIGLIIAALYLTHQRPQRFWLGAIVVGVAAAIKQPALLAAYPVALIGLPWQWNTQHVLNKIARAALSSAIAVGTFVLISVATGLNFGWMNALDVPGRVVTLAPLSLLGEGVRLLCVAAGHSALGTQIAGGLLVAGVVASAVIVSYLAVTVARRRPVTFLSWSYLVVALLGPAMHSWYLLWGGLLLPLTRPTDRMQRVAVVVTSVLLGYGAGNLAWRNDTGIALGLAGLALITTLLVRYFDEHRTTGAHR